MPAKLPEFRLLVNRCLRIAPDPVLADLDRYAGQADPKDLPILVAALREGCTYLLTFNVRDFNPTGEPISVQRPGDFVLTMRETLSALATEPEE